MTRDPIRRRFGKGAARLRVGLPESAERLSALSRTPIRHERRLVLVPVATAALVVWLLATSPLLSPPLASPAPEPIQIALESWPVPFAIEPPPRAAAEPVREPRRSAPRALPTETLALRNRPGPTPKRAPDPAAMEPTRAPFDPSSLATRAPSFSKAEILPAPDAASTTAAGLPESPRSAQASSSAMPAGLASATHARAISDAMPEGLSRSALPSEPSRRRPGTGEAGAGAGLELASGTHAGDQDRRAFLSALERDGESSKSNAQGAAPQSRRPEVSAQGASSPLLAARAKGANASSGTALDGWQEVPLDELPDCTPAGRQDLLKKRILLAAPFQRECSHEDGSYRFVETRNLGAFLMWSRPNPGRRAGQPRDRDACDVLERALACLGNRSSQESSSR